MLSLENNSWEMCYVTVPTCWRETVSLINFKSGFHKRHSTETALLKVTSDILMKADAGECIRNRVGISGSALKWFKSYLSGRKILRNLKNVHLIHLIYKSLVYRRGLFLARFCFLFICFPWVNWSKILYVFLIIFMQMTHRFISLLKTLY